MIRGSHILLISTVLLVASPGAGAQTSILSSKHNLSVSGTGTIKAETERKVCEFCHTPHSPRPSSQLWNRQAPTSTYTLYSSEYLMSKSYSAPAQPKSRSKLCLSCHDGTIALGAVYNNSGNTLISMRGGVTTMPHSTTANLGISLSDDHPVGYQYDPTRDPELVARTWPWATPVKLEPDGPSGTVECHTCHDPHNNEHKKFLRMDNRNAALCTFCHQKEGWNSTIHRTSLQGFTPPGSSPTTVGERSCRNCHQSHGGEGVPYLQNKREEQTCYAAGCHGTTNTGISTKNIQREMEKLYSHPTGIVSGKHRNPDTESSVGVSSRHAECQDCHNPHQARKGLRTPGSNLASNVLYGVKGLEPVVEDSWVQPTAFTEVNPAQKEHQICFKCHSYNGLGPAPNGVSRIIGPSGEYLTDQALEFNPTNGSAHPVRVGLRDQTGSPFPRALTTAQLGGVWTRPGEQTMYCSDCHGEEQQTSSTFPQGPHGSNVRFMLTGRGKFWPTSPDGSLWSLEDIRKDRKNWKNDLFCSNCHPIATGGRFANNVHENRDHQREDVKCVTCHVVVPHGARNPRLIGTETEIKPYNYLGNGQYERLVISRFTKANDPQSYRREDCSMNGLCHASASPGGFLRPGFRIPR